MKARIPSHREFIINFPDSVDQAKANEGWAKLQLQGLSKMEMRLYSVTSAQTVVVNLQRH